MPASFFSSSPIEFWLGASETLAPIYHQLIAIKTIRSTILLANAMLPKAYSTAIAINAIISADLQLTQYSEIRDLPVVDQDKLSDDEKAAFDAVDLGQGVLSQAELLTHRLPEMPADLVPVIEEIWAEEVVGK